MPTNATIETRKMQAVARVKENSYDPVKRTLIVEFASEYPVVRYSWTNDERYEEVLDMSPESGNLARINAGTAVLVNHNRYDDDKMVGTTLRGWFENGKAMAEIQLSGRDSLKEFRQDVQDGIWRNISFGYQVQEYTRTQKDKAKIPTYRATAWDAHEISFASIPADPTVGVRSADGDGQDTNNVTFQTTIIDREMPDVSKKVATENPTEQEVTVVENQRVASPATQTGNSGLDENQARTIADNAVKAERQRSEGIRTAALAVGLDADFASTLVSDGKTLDEARQLILDKVAERSKTDNIKSGHTGTVSKDEIEKQIQVKAAGQAIRTGLVDVSKMDKELVREAQRYAGHSLIGMARQLLEQNGERTLDMSDDEIAERSLVIGSTRAISQSTNDFPTLLGGIVNQLLLAPQALAPYTWKQFTYEVNVKDFRETKFLRTWGLTNLDPVSETGEYLDKPLADGTGETIRVNSFGNIVNMSRHMIINDELDVFMRAVANLIQAADRTIERDVWAMVNSNPTLSDGFALFSSQHGNLAGSAATMSGATLDAMRIAMAGQMDPGSLDYLDLKPSILLTHTGLAKVALQYNETRYDTDATSKTAFKPSSSFGLFDKIVDSPRMNPATAYIALADPNVEPVFGVAFLKGKKTPTITRHEPFRQDGVNIKISHDWGTGILGYRGAYKNAGA